MIIPPKDSAIDANDGIFGDTQRKKWLPLLVGSETYRISQGRLSDVNSKLTNVVTGSLEAKQLNAAYIALNRLGPINASTTGAEGNYDIAKNREGFIQYAFSILFGSAFLPFPIFSSFRVRTKAVL